MEKKFSLLDEPWIKIVTDKMNEKEVSLNDFFANAHTFKRLAGETPTQDFAVLRILLAIAITVFYKYDADGNSEEFDENTVAEDIFDRWSKYYKKGKFNSDIFDKYLEKYRERFYLFHPKTPFFQTPELIELKIGTDYTMQAIMGNIKESNNKSAKHHFSVTDGDEVYNLSYAEITRWIINLNAFGVNVKTKNLDGKNIPAGIGRLGQMGNICVEDENLFKTIMLNLVPLKENNEPWGKPRPVWEKPNSYKPGIQIAPPDNLPELYTIQSRRIIILSGKDSKITGMKVTGGEYYSIENDFNEPMTLWRGNTDKKTEITTYKPRLHNAETFAWQEFPNLIIIEKDKKEHESGLVSWIKKLKNAQLLNKKKIVTFASCGIVYDNSMKYTFVNCISDNLRFSNELLTEKGSIWVRRIDDEIQKCEDVTQNPIYRFSSGLSGIIYGSNDGTQNIKNYLKKEFYFRLNNPFRQWLAEIDPDDDEYDTTQWQKTAYSIAWKVVCDYVWNLNNEIYISRNGKNIPKLLNDYKIGLRIIYPKTE